MSPAILIESDRNTDSNFSSAFSSGSTPSDFSVHTELTEDDQLETIDGNDKDDIAIIGFSLRFPGEATSAEGFWKILVEGRCTATQFPPDRLNHDAFYSTGDTAMGTIRTEKAHFLQGDMGAFDAEFFDIGATEAAAIDPQQRLVLETTYRALENAGITAGAISDSNTCVYTGSFTTDFQAMMAKDIDLIHKYSATGLAGAMLSNRVSSFFNLTGPSVSIDTACSSSLVALDLGCQALRNGFSNLGIVAGSSLMLGPDLTIGLSNMGFLSPDGVCHSFDSRANGYARGEGFGVVVIKPIMEAIRDGDTIRAVIRATRSNHDGKTGLAEPSKHAQKQLIDETYRSANLNRSLTGYVEAHGTGTAIGDPLEAQALGAAIGAYRASSLYVGSVKANIGHLEGTAGVAGLIKSILMLERGIIPPVANLETVNREIDSQHFNLKFPQRAAPWPSSGLRRASVNSFGFGGANSHAVLDDAYHYLKIRGLHANHCTQPRAPAPDEVEIISRRGFSSLELAEPYHGSEPVLLTWSAASKLSIEKLTSLLATHFTGLTGPRSGDTYLKSLAYTLATKRSLLSWRSYAVINSSQELKDFSSIASHPSKSANEVKLAFVFTGQGAQWCGMGRELLVYPVFRDSVERAIEYLRGLGCTWLLADAFTGDGTMDLKIHEPKFSQPICTILQVALVDLLASLGVAPVAVVGHSSGEIAAAYCTGALSRTSAWKLAYYRGVYSQELATSGGGMMSVGLSEAKVQPYLDSATSSFGNGSLTVACVNSPSNVTISGQRTHLEYLRAQLDEDKVFCRVLLVQVAYHGPLMLQVASQYERSIADLTPGFTCHGRDVRMISSVTGALISGDELCSSAYWVRNMVSQVKFCQAVQTLCQHHAGQVSKKIDLSHRRIIQADYLLEIGPHSTLSGPIRDSLKENSKQVTYGSTLTRNTSAVKTILETAGKLHCYGYSMDLLRLNEPHGVSKRTPMILPNLPEYPFDHSRSYWHESRYSKNTRLRVSERNSFIGLPVYDWNPLDCRWRIFLGQSDHAWITDHQVNGTVLFPAAGMLVMAIESAQQLASKAAKSVAAFEIRDAVFHTALKIPAEEAVETQICLRRIERSSNKRADYAEFRLFAYQSDGSIEICKGIIKTIFSHSSSAINVRYSDEIEHMHEFAVSRFVKSCQSCSNSMSRTDLYENLYDRGYQFGPTFQRVLEAKYNGSGEAIGKVETLLNGADKPSIIHPATLDGIFHMSLLGNMKIKGGGSLSTLVPTRLNRLWLPSSGLLPEDTMNFDAWVKVESGGLRSTEASLVALSSDHGTLKAVVDGLTLTSVTGEPNDLAQVNRPLPRRLCWNLEQKPDPSFMRTSELQDYLEQATSATGNPDEYYSETEIMLYVFVKRCIDDLSISDIEPKAYLGKQVAWLRETLSNSPIEFSTIKALAEDEQSFVELLRRIEKYGKKQSELYKMVGENLVNIFHEKLDPLQFLFDNGGEALAMFYEETMADCDFKGPFRSYLDLVCHKNPSLRVLEVGAGTGATSQLALPFMSYQTQHGWESKYSEYAYTDVSAAFFGKAREKFECFPKIKFATLDIENDPAQQGFECGSYDIVIAANVLHATACLSRTLSSVRKLLKTGGKLILFELTTPDSIWAGFVFGILPGWWLATEPDRQQQQSPALSEQKWDRLLSQNSFSGAELIFHGHKRKRMRWASMIIATAVEESGDQTTPSPLLDLQLAQTARPQTLHQTVAEEIATLELKDCQIYDNSNLVSGLDVGGPSPSVAIFVDSADEPILVNLTQITFYHVHNIVKNAKAILWITPCGPNVSDNPAIGAVKGFARCIQSENPLIRFSTLFMTTNSSSSEESGEQARVVRQALEQLLQSSGPNKIEPEMFGINNIIHIPRITPRLDQDNKISEYLLSSAEKTVRFGDHNLRLSIRSPGLLDSLYFSEVEESETEEPLAADEIEVEVQAVGVNFKDCLVALGRVEDKTFGTECSGIVSEVGAECTLRKGDKVIVCRVDTYRRQVRCKEAFAVKIPENLSMVEAAKVATNFVTAWHALMYIGRLSKGDSILIHAAAGGTGQAALQIAQHVGAEIFATVGSQEKQDLLITRYGIASDHILYSRDTSFAEGIKKLTAGRGADVVLNSLAGEQLVASFECIAPYGRFLEIGKADILSHANLPMFPFLRNVSFAAIDLATMTTEKPMWINQALREVAALFTKGVLKIGYPFKTFQVNQIEESFRYLQSGQNAGAVAIEINPATEVQAVVQRQQRASFDSKATYVVAGGLGGQGKSIVRWMLSKQARHFLLLSRSGSASIEAQAFIAELEQAGAKIVAPRCDITDADALAEALKYAAAHLPPIKGCIQAAMVMNDAMFESMSFHEWTVATKPKIQGSWNLHCQLPTNLDFFIMMSSISCVIGSGGQSNYATGNAYQDDLARYRLSLGQKAVSLNLPAMVEEGYLFEQSTSVGNNAAGQKLIEQLYNMKQILSMSQNELFGLLDYFCDRNLLLQDLPGQLVVGLDFPASVRARGLEEAPWMESPLFSHLQVVETSSSADASSDAHASSSVNIHALVMKAETLPEAGLLVANGVRDKLAKVISKSPEEIEVRRSLQAYGVDSLVAVELRNWFAKTVKADVTVMEILGSASIETLGTSVAEKLR